MIDWLDQTLRELLTTRVPFLDTVPPAGIAAEQVGFQPPDRKWETLVDGFAPRRALNLYLVDVRENRVLRSNDRLRETVDGIVIEQPAPDRIDCQYLVSAWSPAAEADGKTVDEHRLLYDAVAVLLARRELLPAEVYGAAGLPAGFPPALAEAALPTVVAPPEGFPKLPEFWGTLERHQPWKPAVWLTVTLPIVAAPIEAGPAVTTIYGGYRVDHDAASEETLFDIGGVVLDGGGLPVGGAWVRLEGSGGHVFQTTTTNDLGRFVFGPVAARPYVFHAGATGFGTDSRTLDVPSTNGEYLLQLT